MPHPIDKENMEHIITDSPRQFRDGLAAATECVVKPSGPLLNICLAGMGGSWMAGALLREAGLLKVPLRIHRSYELPTGVDNHTLFVASSFSGNTEETIAAYQEARTRGISVIGMAAGGELARRCAEDGIPFIQIPANPPTMQPRSATGYGVGILAGVFTQLGLAAEDAPAQLENLAAHLEAFMGTARTRGEEIAPALAKITPVVYASSWYPTLARIWKIKINENAKTPAFWNVFPELNHNEMIGWTQPHGAFHALILQDPEDHARVLKRMAITSELLQKNGISATVVPIEGGTRLEKIFSTLLVGDWLSYRLALELGVDPTPVAMVEDLKRRLKE